MQAQLKFKVKRGRMMSCRYRSLPATKVLRVYSTIQQVLSTPNIFTAAYTEIGGDEELPLGEEFQEHLKRFLKPGERKVKKRIELLKKLVDQLS